MAAQAKTSFVTMRQTLPQDSEVIGIKYHNVKVPVLNGISKRALKLIPYYADWAGEINWDLAAHLVKDVRFLDYAHSFDPSMEVDHFEVLSMFVMPNASHGVLFADVLIYPKTQINEETKEPIHLPIQFSLWSANTTALFMVLEDQNGKKSVVLVREPRWPVGIRNAVQAPAGIISDVDGSFELRASPQIIAMLREAYEEVGMKVFRKDLQFLGRIFRTWGRNSEGTWVFMTTVKMHSSKIAKLKLRQTGLGAEEGEYITVLVVDLEDATKVAPYDPVVAFGCGVLDGSVRRQVEEAAEEI